MVSRSGILRYLVMSLIVCVAACYAGDAWGQSGRKAPKAKPAAVPMPTPEPVATPKPKDDKPLLTLIVGMERLPAYEVVPQSYMHDVMDGCTDQLGKKRTVKVVRVDGDMTRGEAARRARAETESYVVFLQLKTESMSGVIDGSGNLVLEYWVFTPGTAKLATSGRTYPSAYRNKSVILNPRTSGIYGNYQLRQAGEDAADRILSKLLDSIPPKSIPKSLVD